MSDRQVFVLSAIAVAIGVAVLNEYADTLRGYYDAATLWWFNHGDAIETTVADFIHEHRALLPLWLALAAYFIMRHLARRGVRL
jgi:hypothetical protein